MSVDEEEYEAFRIRHLGEDRDLTPVYEYVPPSTLNDGEYLESLDGKSIVIEHPDGDSIGPRNVRYLEVGTVYDNRYVEGTGHVATFLIKTEEGIDAYEDGIRELSPAYEVETRRESGIWQGQRYDLVQTKRRAGNHVAMTRAARGGDRTAFHADSWLQDSTPAPSDEDDDSDDHAKDDSTPKETTMSDDKDRKHLVFGDESVPLRQDQAETIQAWREDKEEREDMLEESLAEARETIEELEAELRMMKKKLSEGGMEGESDAEDMGDYEDMENEDMGGEHEDSEDVTDGDGADPVDFHARYKERRRVDSVAEQVGVEDIEEQTTDELKRAVCDSYFGDAEDVDEWSDAELDAQIKVLAKHLEESTQERDDSLQQATEQDASRGDSEPSGAEKYRQQVYG